LVTVRRIISSVIALQKGKKMQDLTLEQKESCVSTHLSEEKKMTG